MSSLATAAPQRRTRGFVPALIAVVLAMGLALPAQCVHAQSRTGASATAAARSDSVARARRASRARAKKAAAARSPKKSVARTTRSNSPAPAVSTRTATTNPSGNSAAPAAAQPSTRNAPVPSGSVLSAAPSTPAAAAAPPVARGTITEPSNASGTAKRRQSKSTTGAVQRSITNDANGPALGIYAGASAAGFGFGVGPTLGIAWRIAAPTTSLRLRADLMGAHYSQLASALAGGPAITQNASLTHFGASLLAEYSLRTSRSMRPYVVAGGGVYRFQASGPAGNNGSIVSGVFTSTTDVAGIAGLGLQFIPRVYIEARFLTVGNFHTIPITAGVRF